VALKEYPYTFSIKLYLAKKNSSIKKRLGRTVKEMHILTTGFFKPWRNFRYLYRHVHCAYARIIILIIIHLIIKFMLAREIHYTKPKTTALRGSVPSSPWIKVKGQMVQWDARGIKEAGVSEGEWLIVEQSLLCVCKKKKTKKGKYAWANTKPTTWHVYEMYRTILIW